MKIFVTGGAGYIGSVTAEMLLDQGHDVIIFDNLERGHRAALDRRARFIKGDLRNQRDIETALRKTKPKVVVHFAAYALVGESMTHPEWYFGNNLRGGINLLEAMLKARVPKIVFSSSCAVYGQPKRVPITENTPPHPTNPYGESKLIFEKLLEWYGKIYGLKSVALRYFNACGASKKYGEDHHPETHLIPTILRVALKQARHLAIYGNDYKTPDGSCIRDYIHIEDLAQAHILALTGKVSGIFNLGTGDGYSIKQVLAAARKITGRPIPVKISARRPGDPARLVANAGLARKILGWTPRHSRIENILQSAWQWHQAHPGGYTR